MNGLMIGYGASSPISEGIQNERRQNEKRQNQEGLPDDGRRPRGQGKSQATAQEVNRTSQGISRLYAGFFSYVNTPIG